MNRQERVTHHSPQPPPDPGLQQIIDRQAVRAREKRMRAVIALVVLLSGTLMLAVGSSVLWGWGAGLAVAGLATVVFGVLLGMDTK